MSDKYYDDARLSLTAIGVLTYISESKVTPENPKAILEYERGIRELKKYGYVWINEIGQINWTQSRHNANLILKEQQEHE